MLREGVEARDDALSLMREEVDRSVVVLANAAENREVLYCIGAPFVFAPTLGMLRCRSARDSTFIFVLKGPLPIGASTLSLQGRS